MKLQDVLGRVEISKVFTYWQKGNEDAYLSSFFKIVEDQEKDWWQVDFYSPKKDNMTSFVIEQDVKMVGKDSKIFKKDHETISKLDLRGVEITDKQAMQIAHDLMQEKYKELRATKKIVILQNIRTTIWNITCITTSLKLFNVRIDAGSGEVLDDSLKSLLDFKHDAEQ